MNRLSLSADERIKSRKDFEKIYSSGKIIFSEDKKLKAVFITENDDCMPVVKIAAGVSKKAGNAVKRNRIKRLIKDSYRLNKHSLIDFCLKKRITIKVVFSPAINTNIEYKFKLKDFMPSVIDLMEKIKKSLQ